MQVSQAFNSLFMENVAASLDKQAYLWEYIRNTSEWECDLDKGSICFQDSLDFQIQLLGRESTEDETWVWAWADILPDVNPEILECARNLKRVGEQLRVPELVTPEIPLSLDLQGHIIGAIASGICESKGYYCCSDGEDCLFILIQDYKFKRNIESPAARIADIFPDVLGNYHISDPQTALIEYLKFYQLDIYSSANKIVGKGSADEVVEAIFDGDKLVKIEAISSYNLSELQPKGELS